jgi:hypothetical protein
MFAPATELDGPEAPRCPTCVRPMTVVRIVRQTPNGGLRVFRCEPCGVAMFTEI